MSHEVAFLFDKFGNVTYWHDTADASNIAIPDSDTLYAELQKPNVIGMAHSHPGSGPAIASTRDVETFRALCLGLGRDLLFPVCTDNEVRTYNVQGDRVFDVDTHVIDALPWEQLRERSRT